jgi:hypothetical protein
MSAEKAVVHIARIRIVSRDRSPWGNCISDGALEGACARARSVERGDCTVVIAQVAVVNIACIREPSRYGSLRVDAIGVRTLPGAYTRAWNVECGNGTVRSTQPGVRNIVRIEVEFLRKSPLGSVHRKSPCTWYAPDPRLEYRMR